MFVYKTLWRKCNFYWKIRSSSHWKPELYEIILVYLVSISNLKQVFCQIYTF